jgi:hypothetical protein
MIPRLEIVPFAINRATGTGARRVAHGSTAFLAAVKIVLFDVTEPEFRAVTTGGTARVVATPVALLAVDRAQLGVAIVITVKSGADFTIV